MGALNKKLIMNVTTCWNSTYFMLQRALGFKKVFAKLAIVDQAYKEEPSEEEWTQAQVLCDYFSLFYVSLKFIH